jgi:hypothetical protein
MERGVLLGLLLIASGCDSTQAPMRPKLVAESAAWAGGPDGGAWIDCAPSAKEPYLEYTCTTYYESGNVWSSGVFIVAERQRNGTYGFPSGPVLPPRIHRYQDYDGRRIYVSDQRSLIPNGWIDHPLQDGHGKRERYEAGTSVEEINY